MVCEFEERGIDLHLPSEHRAQPLVGLLPRRNIFGPRRQLAIRRNDTELLLPGKGLLAQLVPTLVEPSLVLRDPVLRHMVWRVGRAGREIDEERFVWRDRFL